MKFTKMHGCGNDYVYVNCFKEKVENPGEVSVKISDRHFGIGSDGLILICPSEIADFKMRMFNSDGSEGAMCGNGVRCVAKYVYDYGLTDKTFVSLETKAGIKYLDITVEDGKATMIKVDMGAPITKPADIPAISDKEIIVDEPIEVDGKEYRVTCVSMGNPHAVLFVEDTKTVDIENIGPKLEHHKMFPDRANIEFIQVVDRNHIKMRVWERGAGETLACGTGTCASVYACILNGLTEDSVDVEVLGGTIHIDYDREKNTIFMTGPAAVSFDGEIYL